MNYPKIFGWILLIAGLTVIVWTLVYSFNIFTAKTQVPELFQSDQQVGLQNLGNLNVQAQIQEMINQQLQNALPADFIARLMNLAAWSILAFILVFGGSQISNLGIKLIKQQ